MAVGASGETGRASPSATCVACRASGSNQDRTTELSRFDVLKYKRRRVEIPGSRITVAFEALLTFGAVARHMAVATAGVAV